MKYRIVERPPALIIAGEAHDRHNRFLPEYRSWLTLGVWRPVLGYDAGNGGGVGVDTMDLAIAACQGHEIPDDPPEYPKYHQVRL